MEVVSIVCEIYSYRTDIETIKAMNPKGIILTGGPNSCYEADSPTYSKELFELGIPVLGLCYGAQLMMHMLGMQYRFQIIHKKPHIKKLPV